MQAELQGRTEARLKAERMRVMAHLEGQSALPCDACLREQAKREEAEHQLWLANVKVEELMAQQQGMQETIDEIRKSMPRTVQATAVPLPLCSTSWLWHERGENPLSRVVWWQVQMGSVKFMRRWLTLFLESVQQRLVRRWRQQANPNSSGTLRYCFLPPSVSRRRRTTPMTDSGKRTRQSWPRKQP